ncbi:hypothetical protein [Rhodopseudomonas sp. P2A-2r]|uniref:hypothetical protein n=1 Tax=unclassified Rhodopseudomonas TaxID=2638247 RepID=UPI0022343CBE|nr:hypothetical protein [Rhodopseudomonas sp. P2A-2r]UZE49947.1 hypothetical protein ONR75_03975 [Rhodopseudomonas sp. P2A-2r]
MNWAAPALQLDEAQNFVEHGIKYGQVVMIHTGAATKISRSSAHAWAHDNLSDVSSLTDASAGFAPNLSKVETSRTNFTDACFK